MSGRRFSGATNTHGPSARTKGATDMSKVAAELVAASSPSWADLESFARVHVGVHPAAVRGGD